MIKPTKAKTVTQYLDSIDGPRRSEMARLHALIRRTVPQLEPHLVGAMVGYGNYHYRYATGREGDWPIIALASQKNYISVYVCASEDGRYVAERSKALLPKASIGRSCIRFKRLTDIDPDALARVIREGAAVMARTPAVRPKPAARKPVAKVAKKTVARKTAREAAPARRATRAR